MNDFLDELSREELCPEDWPLLRKSCLYPPRVEAVS